MQISAGGGKVLTRDLLIPEQNPKLFCCLLLSQYCHFLLWVIVPCLVRAGQFATSGLSQSWPFAHYPSFSLFLTPCY